MRGALSCSRSRLVERVMVRAGSPPRRFRFRVCYADCSSIGPLVSPLLGESLFFACPKKRNQKKRHPGFRALASRGFPAMLGTPAAAETRGCAAQTVSGGQPRRVCASRRFAKGPERQKQKRVFQQVSWRRAAPCV